MVEIPKWKIRCVICNKRYLAVRRSRKYCSALCRHRAGFPLMGPLPKKRCEWCDKLFRSGNSRGRFCGEKCYGRNWTENNRAYYNRRMREMNYKTRVRTPWLLIIRSAKLRARENELKYNLTPAWGKARWTGKCEVSGLPFVILPKSRRTVFSPTIDRIDGKGGYTKNNSRFVLWGVNAFKHDGTHEEMLRIARGIVMQSAPQAVEEILSLPG